MTSIPSRQDITGDLATKAAREMIDRYGANAKAEALRRAADLEVAARWPEHALALRVLSAVEQLLGAGS